MSVLIQAIEYQSIEVRIYQVLAGYRVEMSGLGTQFYWHPGIFAQFEELWEWLLPQLEAFARDGLPLGGEWMMLEGDFDDNGFYCDWFICKTQAWQGYDPLTNCCHTASTWQALKQKIDEIQAGRN
ncbi:MAG: hypothetical protein ACFB4I_12095 [Cyanophyceae cyanobacterium]